MFVTLEGTEGAGKSSVLRQLGVALTDLGNDVLLTHEPGDSSIGRRIREILLEGGELDSKTELLLFLADRSQHVAEIVRPALDAGKLVLCDRYSDSTVVYQGYARGLDISLLREWNEYATERLKPDLTILLDLDPEIGLKRLVRKDRLDAQPMEFHNAVRSGFMEEAKRDQGRWFIIDASQSIEEVTHAALHAVLQRKSELVHARPI
jgi:dTMP kinase